MITASILIMISGEPLDSRKFGSCVEPWAFVLDGFDLTARGADGTSSWTISEHRSRQPKPSRFKLSVVRIVDEKP